MDETETLTFGDRAVRDVMCPRCEARPGDPCVTVSGNVSREPHTPRWEPLAEVYGEGYQDGMDSGR